MSKTSGEPGEDQPGPVARFMGSALGKNASYGAEAIVQLVPLAGGALGVVIGMARDGVAQREFERIVTGINTSLVRVTDHIESIDGALAHLGEAFYAASHRVVNASLETPDPDKRQRMREALASGVIRGWDDETQYFLRVACKHEALEATVLSSLASLMVAASHPIDDAVKRVWATLTQEQQAVITQSHVRGVAVNMEADGLVTLIPAQTVASNGSGPAFYPDASESFTVTPLGVRYLEFLREGEERADGDR